MSENWNALIEDVVAGRWRDPASGRTISLPFDAIRLEPSLEGAEADLVAPLELGARLAVVSDTNTVEAMGRRVAKALRGIASVDEIVLPDGIACTEATIADIEGKLSRAQIIDPRDLSGDKIVFGATVTLLDEDDKQVKYQIVGQTEANAKTGRISYNSPLGRGLIGRKVDEEVEVTVPSGDRYYVVSKIEFI